MQNIIKTSITYKFISENKSFAIIRPYNDELSEEENKNIMRAIRQKVRKYGFIELCLNWRKKHMLISEHVLLVPKIPTHEIEKLVENLAKKSIINIENEIPELTELFQNELFPLDSIYEIEQPRPSYFQLRPSYTKIYDKHMGKLKKYAASSDIAFVSAAETLKNASLLKNIKALYYNCFKTHVSGESQTIEAFAVIDTYHNPDFANEILALAEKYGQDKILVIKAGAKHAEIYSKDGILKNITPTFEDKTIKLEINSSIITVEEISDIIEPRIRTMAQYNEYKNAN